MLVRDGLGYVHNIPDYSPRGPQQVIYDGLGNPVGFAFLAPLLSALAPALPSIIGGLFGGKKEEPAAAPPMAPVAPPPLAPWVPPPAMVAPPQEAMTCPPCPPCPVCPVCGTPTDEMPAPPPGMRLVRLRRRRRVHAHPR